MLFFVIYPDWSSFQWNLVRQRNRQLKLCTDKITTMTTTMTTIDYETHPPRPNIKVSLKSRLEYASSDVFEFKKNFANGKLRARTKNIETHKNCLLSNWLIVATGKRNAYFDPSFVLFSFEFGSTSIVVVVVIYSYVHVCRNH